MNFIVHGNTTKPFVFTRGEHVFSPSVWMIQFLIDLEDEFDGSRFHRILSAFGLNYFFVVYVLDKRYIPFINAVKM